MQIRMPLWWSFVLFMALAIGLAACDSPSMAFHGIKPTRIIIEGSSFSVRHTRFEAEAIGRGFQPGARRRDIVIKGVAAIEAVSGCRVVVRTVRGDTNLVAADLKCPDGPMISRPVRPVGMDCVGYEGSGIANDGMIELSCNFVRR